MQGQPTKPPYNHAGAVNITSIQSCRGSQQNLYTIMQRQSQSLHTNMQRAVMINHLSTGLMVCPESHLEEEVRDVTTRRALGGRGQLAGLDKASWQGWTRPAGRAWPAPSESTGDVTRARSRGTLLATEALKPRLLSLTPSFPFSLNVCGCLGCA
jgi:hypothetical protein